MSKDDCLPLPSDHPTGKLYVDLHNYVGPLWCAKCQQDRPAGSFLQHWTRRKDGRVWMSGTARDFCVLCAPTRFDIFPCESGMRIAELRDSHGEPVRWRQHDVENNFGKWYSMKEMELLLAGIGDRNLLR